MPGNRRCISRLAFGVLASAAFAIAAHGEGLPGRYTIERIEEGFLRLDSRTGRMAICTATARVWSCRTITDDAELLRIDNERLQARIAELETKSTTLKLSTDPEVRRVMEELAQLVDRLLRAIRS